MTDEKRQSRPILSLDFVTALSLDECRDRLLQIAPAAGHDVSVWDDHSFTIRCCTSNGEAASARFWGTLEARERGTWVWGTSIEEGRDRPEWPSRRTTILLLALIVLAATAFTLGDARLLLVALGLIFASMLLRIWTWRRRHDEALQIIKWVWETLYVPLREIRPNETEAQS